MPKQPLIPEQQFIALYIEHGPAYIARLTGHGTRDITRRKARLEKRLGITITAPGARVQQRRMSITAALDMEIKNGSVVIGSDPHYWPELISTAHIAMVQLTRELKPKAVIMNGDVTDGASISRHPPIGWEKMPTVDEELQVCAERLGEIERAAPKAKLFWPAGNHDLRLETNLASKAPEMKGVQGTSLHQHFSKRWQHCWLVKINDHIPGAGVYVKHRFKGGSHAAYTNAVTSGKNIVTGHLHKGVMRAFTDYNGTRWGIDMPTLAEPNGPQFQDYTELNPTDWRSGLVVLTFKDGRLMQPEMALTISEGVYEFRGQHHKVSVEDL